MPSVHVRKGLPFSLELGGRVGWVEKSRMVAATGELKWAVNEGFTYLPDIAVRGHVTKLFGAGDFDLTGHGLDFGVGKQFPLGGMITLTPYGGLDLTFVRRHLQHVDFNPRPTLRRVADDDSRASLARNTADYARCPSATTSTSASTAGVRFIGGVLQLGAEFSVTRLGSFDVPTGTASRHRAQEPSRRLAFNTTLGLDF